MITEIDLTDPNSTPINQNRYLGLISVPNFTLVGSTFVFFRLFGKPSLKRFFLVTPWVLKRIQNHVFGLFLKISWYIVFDMQSFVNCLVTKEARRAEAASGRHCFVDIGVKGIKIKTA